MVEKFGIPYKAIIGFLTVFFGQLLARMTIDGVTVFPETMSGWGSLIGGSAFAALVIYLKANTYTVPQAQNNLVKAKARV